MKYIKQFLMILVISFAGEVMKIILPLPVPASIYGMILLFILLITGILNIDKVKETGRFLIEIMPLMFIPAGVGLIESWYVLAPMIFPVGIITIISFLCVMVLSGRITQRIIRHDKKRSELK